MIADMSKEEELISLYEHMLGELRDIVNDKIVVLDEVSEMFKAMEKIQIRLAQLYEEEKNDETS